MPGRTLVLRFTNPCVLHELTLRWLSTVGNEGNSNKITLDSVLCTDAHERSELGHIVF